MSSSSSGSRSTPTPACSSARSRLPDPDQPWQGERALGRPADGLVPHGDSFCKFHDRCPYAMPICVEEAPPLFRTAPHRVTACYLYREAPVVNTDEMTDVFAGADRKSVAGKMPVPAAGSSPTQASAS